MNHEERQQLNSIFPTKHDKKTEMSREERQQLNSIFDTSSPRQHHRNSIFGTSSPPQHHRENEITSILLKSLYTPVMSRQKRSSTKSQIRSWSRPRDLKTGRFLGKSKSKSKSKSKRKPCRAGSRRSRKTGRCRKIKSKTKTKKTKSQIQSWSRPRDLKTGRFLSKSKSKRQS